jgi:type IV pilus assembly protein PilA
MTPSVQPLQPPAKKKFPVWLIVILATAGAFCLIVPVLAVLGIYGTRKYIANAKTAEARNALGQIAKDAATAYESEDLDNPPPGKHGAAVHRLCASATTSVPASIAFVKGRKYQSSPSEWEVDKAANAGFYCLKFAMDMPQYYQYSYTSHGASSPRDGFVAMAHGDLNGDGITSEFSIMGQISPGGTLTIAPSLLEKDPEE